MEKTTKLARAVPPATALCVLCAYAASFTFSANSLGTLAPTKVLLARSVLASDAAF